MLSTKGVLYSKLVAVSLLLFSVSSLEAYQVSGKQVSGKQVSGKQVGGQEVSNRSEVSTKQSAVNAKITDITAKITDIKPTCKNLASKFSDLSANIKGTQAEKEKFQKDLSDLKAKKVGDKIVISLLGDILFDFDKWNIKPEAEETLFKVSSIFKKLENKKLLIKGHTDSKGSDAYNLRLSKYRAESVKDWLSYKAGIDSHLIEAIGYGESKPVAPNKHPDGSDNPEGRQKNRRVEIVIQNR